MKNRLMCHLIANYPDFNKSFEIAEALARGGADSIEVQFPFSDPSADGPYILKACDIALKNGFTVDKGFDLVRRIVNITKLDVFIMSYANIPYTRGLESFVKESASIGIRGLIIPDLTLNNDEGLIELGEKYTIPIIPVITLTTPQERIDAILSIQPEYVYAVLRKGITGESTEITNENITFLKNLSQEGVKVLGGFGINSREQVNSLAPYLFTSVAGTVFVKEIEKETGDMINRIEVLTKYLISTTPLIQKMGNK
ncbi:MAG: tryptophan synthase subunit alpha [Spirochaetales bacterium]|nr:tryptophan synthase subunit alpha [Spirochaetales bacterium]